MGMSFVYTHFYFFLCKQVSVGNKRGKKCIDQQKPLDRNPISLISFFADVDIAAIPLLLLLLSLLCVLSFDPK